MIYLKTIFTNIKELDLVCCQIRELNSIVDKVILIEPSFTHNGAARNLIGINSLSNKLSDSQLDKIIYLVVPKLDYIIVTQSEALHHKYETVTRGYFRKQIRLNYFDIIISTDGDEILYNDIVSNVVSKMKKSFLPFKRFKFKLHQFFYKDDLLAKNHPFIAPGIYHYATTYLDKSFYIAGFSNWRYKGTLVDEIGGVHFSWFLDKQEVLNKVKTWSHSSQFTDLSDQDILTIFEKDLKLPQYSFRHDPIKLTKIKNTKQFWPISYGK
ncbi:MAG: hypothetical protein P8I51_04265 [Polaribacter sp.]|jgi:hypothetical protein|nr:hypothetical protein [Polaribacter sp.]